MLVKKLQIWALLFFCVTVNCHAQTVEEAAKSNYARENYASALRDFLAAAKLGNAEAFSYLGVMYAYGQGTAVDEKKAEYWLNQAMTWGNPPAIVHYTLGYLNEKERNGYSNVRESVRLYFIAAKKDFPEAKDALERLSDKGLLAGNNEAQTYVDELKRRRLATYRQDFNAIKGIEDAEAFLQKYENYDPDAKLATVRQKMTALHNDAKRSAAKKNDVFRRDVSMYRSRLASGQDTHCGLLVELKGRVAKVQTQVGVVWFKTEELYPPRAGVPCNFFNNIYQELGANFAPY